MTRQIFEYHPTFGYRFIPGIKARVEHEGGGYLLRANQAGFRCRHEFAPEKQPGRFRVLLFGDSYTAGDGVSDRDRYGDQLEVLLPGLEVYNFGLSGTGSDQHYLIYRELGSGLEHDLVVIGVLVENIRRVVARFRPFLSPEGDEILLAKPYFSLSEQGDVELHHVPVPRDPVPADRVSAEQRAHVDEGGRLTWLRELVNRLGPGPKELAQRLSRYQPLPGYDDPDSPDWRLMKAILARWTRELRVPAVICPIPLYQHVEKTASARGYRARFRELEDPPGVSVCDPLDDFHRYSAAERRGFRFPTDCHLTPAAHRVLAESLAPRIESFMAAAGR